MYWSWVISYLLTFLLYTILLLLLYLIHLDRNDIPIKDVITIDFQQTVLPKINISTENLTPQIKEKREVTIPVEELFSNFKKAVLVVDSTNYIPLIIENSNKDDTLRIVNTQAIIDSFVLKYPSLTSLSAAIREDIKTNMVQKTNNEIFNERVKKAMQDYYKMKYPTPIHKFGEQGGGTGILIPIDDIIELFK